MKRIKHFLYIFVLCSVICCGLGLSQLSTAMGGKNFDTYLGQFNGVAVYSNGTSNYYSGTANYVNGTYTGIKWQCVEYVRRYYLTVYNTDLASKHIGDANTWYDNASKMGLTSYRNSSTTSIPQTGDILVSNGGKYGHIAIVKSVSNNKVYTIQQNFSNDYNDTDRALDISTDSKGRYTVKGFSRSYSIKGWLRK